MNEPQDASQDNTHDDDAPPSKTERKKAMLALQALGEELVALSAEQLARFDLPENLLDAVRAAQRITQHEARRRQGQYIGKLMRDIDPQAIRLEIDRIKGVSAAATAHLHRLERWRERLIADDGALDELIAEHPGQDAQALQHMRQLIRNARRERAEAKPPKAYRQIYQRLKDIFDNKDTTPT